MLFLLHDEEFLEVLQFFQEIMATCKEFVHPDDRLWSCYQVIIAPSIIIAVNNDTKCFRCRTKKYLGFPLSEHF